MGRFSGIKYTINRAMPPLLYEEAICLQYYTKLRRICDLSNPRRYTEKIQWAKMNRKNPLLTTLSDKIEVRGWVKDKIGEEYLIPTIGDVYSCAENIDFNQLPDKFVIKANHGSGYNIVVNNKNDLDVVKIKRRLNTWLSHNFAFYTFEMQYRDIIPKLYIEKNISLPDDKDLPDYKFFCFNGKVFCSYTMVDYIMNHNNGRLGFFDRDYKIMPYYRTDFEPIKEQLPMPPNYRKMIELAEILAEDFSHVRVDFYNVHGKIYFGEMTFTNASGLCKFSPDEFDYILGEQWDLNSGI